MAVHETDHSSLWTPLNDSGGRAARGGSLPACAAGGWAGAATFLRLRRASPSAAGASATLFCRRSPTGLSLPRPMPGALIPQRVLGPPFSRAGGPLRAIDLHCAVKHDL